MVYRCKDFAFKFFRNGVSSVTVDGYSAKFNENNEKIGEVTNISTNSSQDLLNIKNLIGKVDLVPFVNEFFPVVDIEKKKIIIKPIFIPTQPTAMQTTP